MQDINQFRPMPWHVVTHRGHAVLMTDLHGFIGGGIDGFYFRQTRFLSRFRLTVDGQAPRAVSANAVAPHAAIAYYLAASPVGRAAGAQPDNSDSDGGEIVAHGIEVQVNSFVEEGLRQEILVANHTLRPATVTLGLEFDADFADLTEAGSGRRRQNAPVERRWRPGELVLSYGHPRLPHAAEIRCSGPAEFRDSGGAVCCTLDLPPQRPARIEIALVPVFCRERVGLLPSKPSEEPRPLLHLEASSPQVQRAWDRAVADLAALPMLEGEGLERRTPVAGIPKFMALFGRDTLITAFQAGFLEPATVLGTMRLVARWHATRYDDRYDAQPGRVIHQHQKSPLALLGETPFLHYYGDYTAPAWFLIDAAWHLALTADRQAFQSLRGPVLATLDWIDRDADRDGDGFYEYDTRAGDWGEKNQGWKDSGDAILYENGLMVPNPIALVDIQGCYYAAKQLAGLAFAELGEDGLAQRLLADADRLKRRFNEAFWLPQEGYFALALDPAKRPVGTVTADPGHCLAFGIVDEDKAEAVADRIMMPDLFTGWGVRTLSDRHPAYNPFGYHLGSVWPAANSLTAFGLKRYGFNGHLHRLLKGLFEAAGRFHLSRLPEVFGGQPRDAQHPHPGIYPDANTPQAWSAGAIVLLVQSLLGLVPLAPRGALIIDPDLPEWLPELTLRGVRIGGARLDLRFSRDGRGYTRHEILDRQGPVRVVRAEPSPPGVDRFARLMRELVSPARPPGSARRNNAAGSS